MVDLGIEIGILKAELRNVCREIEELKESQKLLLKFMYNIQGGKAWFFGILTISAAMGAIISNFFGIIFPHK